MSSTKALVLTFLLFTTTAFGTGCFQPSPHTAVTLLLVDRTDLLKDRARFSQLITAIKSGLQPGERFMAASVTDHANSARLLIDLVKQESSAWKSVLKARKEEKDFVQCLENFEAAVLKTEENYKHSALLETFAFASQVLEGDSSARKNVILYSDMLQNSENLTFYRVKSINPAASLAKAKQAGLVKSLKGAHLYYITNSGSLGEKLDRQIEAFWRKYSETTGAEVKLYGPMLTNFP